MSDDDARLLQACDEACSRAVEALQASPGASVGVWTRQGRHAVLVGLALRGKGAFAVLVDNDQYSGLRLMEWVMEAANG